MADDSISNPISYVILSVAVFTLALFLIIGSNATFVQYCSLSQQTTGLESTSENGDGVQALSQNTQYPIYSVFSAGANGGGNVLVKNSPATPWSFFKNLTTNFTSFTTDNRPVSIWSPVNNDVWVGTASPIIGQGFDNLNGANLITNPGFETYTTSPGIPDSWTSGTTTGSTFSKETSIIDSGSNSLKLVENWNGAGTGTRYIKQSLTVTANSYYGLSVKYYVPSALSSNKLIILKIRDLTDSKDVISNYILPSSTPSTPLNQWIKSVSAFKAISAHSYEIEIGLSAQSTSTSTDTIYFDSINLQVESSMGVYPLLHYNGSTWTPYLLKGFSDLRWSATNPGISSSASPVFDARSIWGTSSTNLYMVDNGVTASPQSGIIPQRIWKYDGTSWSAQSTPNSYELITVYGFGSNNIWAVGGERASQGSGFVDNGTILHYDGSTWYFVQSPVATKLEQVWGANANDIWAVGGDTNLGKAIHWNGNQWVDMTSQVISQTGVTQLPALRGVSGRTASDVYFVGSNGLLFHWNGNQFDKITTGTGTNLREVDDIWVDHSGNVYMIGNNGLILAYSCYEQVVPREYSDYGIALVPLVIGVGLFLVVMNMRKDDGV